MCAARLAPKSLEALETRVLFAAGDLDPTFAGGIVTLDINPSEDRGFAVAAQADGKVLVGGRARIGAGNDFAIARFNADGSIDTTFGASGVVTTNMSSTSAGSDGVYAIKVLSDGKIIAVGDAMRNGSKQDFAVAKYNSDGTPDTTFGAGGKAYADFGNTTDMATSLAVGSTGRIVVAGTTLNGSSRVAVAVFTSTGALDTTFGAGGKVTTASAADDASGESVALLANGSIVVAGTVSNGSGNFLAVKYTAAGLLDSTFGTGGLVVVDFGHDESAHALAVQADGKIVLAGEQLNDDGYDMALTRLNANGTLDAAFGTITTDFAGGFDVGRSVAVQADGRIVVGGTATVGDMSGFGLARFNANGTLDSSFKGGKVSFAIGEDAAANAVTLDGDGNILVAGFSGDGFDNYTFAAARVIAKTNAAPTANPGSGYNVDEGGSVALDGSGSFDSDGSIVLYEWDLDYNGATFTADATGAAVTFSAAGLNGPLVKTIALRVTDNDGATHMTTTTVTIHDVPPPPNPKPDPKPIPNPTPKPDRNPNPKPGSIVVCKDPNAAGKTILTVYGTSNSDKLALRTSKGKIAVMLGRKTLGTFDVKQLSQIVMYGLAGNDCIDAHNSPVPVMLFGGDGKDVMIGSKFGDILIGGAGDDQLFGFHGGDLLVGGAGKDKMYSLFGDDLMVGDGLTFENNITELKGLLKTWTAKKAPGNLTSSVVDDKVKDKFNYASKKDGVIDTPEKKKIEKKQIEKNVKNVKKKKC